MPKCPVCKTEFTTQTVCSVCGFTELTPSFLSKEEADYWTKSVVVPYHKQWQQSDVWRTLTKEDELWRYEGYDAVVEIPSRFKTIGGCAFFNNDSLKILIIPSTVKRIKENAFSICRNLNAVVFKGRFIVVEKYAFSGSHPKYYFEDIESPYSSYHDPFVIKKSLDNLSTGLKYFKDEWYYDANGVPISKKVKL